MIYRYSAINTAYQCLRKYQLQYLEGIQPEGESGDMAFGSAIHYALYTHFDSKKDDVLGDVSPIEVFNTIWEMSKEKEMKYARQGWAELREQGEIFIERFIKLRAKDAKPEYLEKEMQFFIGNHKFSGTADVIGKYKDVPSVIDFKTSAYAYDKRKLKTNEQMYIYAHAAKQVLNYEAQQLVYVVFVKNPAPRIQVITIPLTQTKLNSMIDNVRAMADDLAQRKYFPMNRNSCLNCNMYKHCYGDE